MNIQNTVSTYYPLIQTIKPAKPEQAQDQKVAPPVFSPKPEYLKSYCEQFYSYEPEPWKREDRPAGRIDEPQYTRAASREEYIFKLNKDFTDRLEKQAFKFDLFRTELGVWHPELANKKFGYSLDSRGQLTVLNTNNELSEDECRSLTDKLNRFGDLKEQTRYNAKVMMALTDHDTATFGNKYRFNLDSIIDVIDFAKLNTVKPSELQQCWIDQVKQNAKRPDNELIDIYA